MVATSQLLILMLLAGSIAAANAQSEEGLATLAYIDETKVLECAAYNTLFDLCICLKQEAESGESADGIMEAAAEWERMVEECLAGLSTITDADVQLSNITVVGYEGQPLDEVQMAVIGNSSFIFLVTAELNIVLVGRYVESAVSFEVCFSA